jgi:6-phosphogluconate dehydrogenase (decarboxylating)
MNKILLTTLSLTVISSNFLSADAGVVKKGVDGTKEGVNKGVEGTKKGASVVVGGTKKGVGTVVNGTKKGINKVKSVF